MIQTRPAEAAVPVKTTREVLLHAALLIEERGWCQNKYQSSNGRVCLVGAVRLASGLPAEPGGDDWERQFSDWFGKGVTWNDADHRTAAEVVAALRATADAS